MIFRIFMILFAVNMAVFWVKAHASEPNADSQFPAVQIARQSQAVTTRSVQSYERHERWTELGVRLLRWEFRGTASPKHYATEKVSMVPSISILPEGAAFNMRWRF